MDGDRQDAFLQLGCLMVIALVVSIFVIVAFWIKGGYEGGYRAGQIDAIQGDVRYELSDRPDGTREWVERKGDHAD